VYDATTGETFIFFGGPGRTAQDTRLDVTAVSSTDLVSPPSSRLLVPDLLPPLPRCFVGHVFSSARQGVSWSAPKNLSSSCMRPGTDPHFNGGLSGDTPADGVSAPPPAFSIPFFCVAVQA